jgi:hypothetical protein
MIIQLSPEPAQRAAALSPTTRARSNFLHFDPGACAPGFILPPAPQVPVNMLYPYLHRRFFAAEGSFITTEVRDYRGKGREPEVREADESIKPGAQAPG